MKHTPTPWHTQRGSIVGNGKEILVLGDSKPNELDLANAAHIVKCVNMHDELVAALVDFVNGVETGAIVSDMDETLANAVRKAKATLKMARGGDNA